MTEFSVKPYKSFLFLRILCVFTMFGSLFNVFITIGFISFDKLFTSIYILLGILCFVGAVMMFKLKKNGFYIYVLAQLFQIIYSFIFVIDTYALYIPILSDLVVFLYFLMIFWPLLFVVLYAFNFNHLK